MKTTEKRRYTERIRWRIRWLWCAIAAMMVYMVAVGELGGGDPRVLPEMARTVSDLMFFGGLAFLIWRLVRNRRLLRDRELRKEQFCQEQDERNRFLHNQSGGIVLDFLLAALFIATMTAGMFSTDGFYMAAFLLILAVVLKGAAYGYFSHYRNG